MMNSVMSLDSPSSMISGSPGRKISTVPRTKSPLPYLERNMKIVGCLTCEGVRVLVTMMADIQAAVEGDLRNNRGDPHSTGTLLLVVQIDRGRSS